MPHLLKQRFLSKGKIAGSLIFIGEQKLEKVRIRAMVIDRENLVEKECDSFEEAYNLVDPGKMTWINIDGLHDPEVFSEIGKRLNVSALMLEDIMNTGHRPKFEEDENFICIITKLLSLDKEKQQIDSEQFGLLVGDHFVLSFQERVGTYFESLRNRIRQAKVRLLSVYPDYLAYALLDCVVDSYLEIAGEIGNEIESLEQEVLQNPKKSTVEEIYRHRTELNTLRRTIRPLREITTQIMKTDSPRIREAIRHFLLDLNDHVITLLEEVDSYQTVNMDQFNMYNTGISNRANEIMKTLTIFASIFIPLTFIAGIYGMNFDFIPELHWQRGYLYFWGIILCVGLGFFVYFKRKKWF
jgi:magnesium transporter